jgi:hypothetical protein
MDNLSILPEEEKPKALAEMDKNEVIFACGKLSLPASQVVRILHDKLTPAQRGALILALEDKASPEFQLYAQGQAQGDAEIKLSLHENAAYGDSDAYKNLTAEQRKNAINQSIRKNFGIGESD